MLIVVSAGMHLSDSLSIKKRSPDAGYTILGYALLF
jgi:hypothetical protein